MSGNIPQVYMISLVMFLCAQAFIFQCDHHVFSRLLPHSLSSVQSSINEIFIDLDSTSFMKIEDVISFNELSARNTYESQVLSSLPTLSGKRIKSFRPRKLSNETTSQWNQDMKSFLSKQDQSFFIIKTNNLNINSEIECDLYFKASSYESMAFRNIFRDSILSHTILSRNESMLEYDLDNKWVLIEICQDPKLLPNKLCQLERAARLLPLLDSNISFGGFAVLLNGEKAIYEKSISLLKLSDEFLITKYPLLIGWVPTRNVHSTVRNIEKQVESISKEMKLQREEMKLQREETRDIKVLLERLVNAENK
jgi:hypothetical protein